MSYHFAKVITLLFIGSNYKSKEVVRTEKEYETIRNLLKTTFFGKLINFKKKFAVKRSDLEKIIEKYRPQIIHFSGHGTHYVGPIFEGDGDEYENSCIDMTEELTNLLKKYKDFIELVFFNVCDSSNIAMRAAKSINFTIGANGKPYDAPAIAFTKGFYENFLNNDNLRESVEIGNNEHNNKLSNILTTSKIESPYMLYSSITNDSTYVERSFLETVRTRNTNLISYLIYSNPSYVGLTNYNYYFKKIRQLNLNELKKWNDKNPSEFSIKTTIAEDWAGHQLINHEETVKLLLNIDIDTFEPNLELDKDTQYEVEKFIKQYNFSIVKKKLITLLEEYDNVKELKDIKKGIIRNLKLLLMNSREEFQLLGFIYFNDDNSIRDKDFEISFDGKGKDIDFSIRKPDSNEIFVSNRENNLHILKEFGEYIKLL